MTIVVNTKVLSFARTSIYDTLRQGPIWHTCTLLYSTVSLEYSIRPSISSTLDRSDGGNVISVILRDDAYEYESIM